MKRPMMKAVNIITLVFFVSSTSAWQNAIAADTFVIQPARFITVKGDAAKFRALNWMNDGYTGGIKDIEIERKLSKDEHLTFEGHAIPGDNDEGASLLLTKDKFGYLKMDYSTFRKWYDNVGGYYPYNKLAINQVTGDLSLDIGHFLLETGVGEADDPTVSLSYERDTKNGSKDRLTWASVVDNSIYGAAVSKKTAPSYATLDETTDTVTLKGKVDMAGNVTLKGSQSYEFFNAHNFREEQQLATVVSGVPDANLKIRRQIQDPQTKLLTSNVMASRWSLNDQTYVSAGYLFAHSRNSEIETIREYTGLGVLTGAFSNPKIRDGFALNTENKNIWTAQLFSNLTDSLTFDSKFKAEIISRESFSKYDLYGTSLTVVGSDNAVSENKTIRTGQSVGLHFNGLPKTSLYSQLEMQQERNWLSEERIPVGTADSLINYENITNKPEFIGTLGARYVPTRWINLTGEYKRHNSEAKYDTIHNNTFSVPPANVPGESFLNKLQTVTDEIAAKISWKPLKWLQNAFKYKISANDYHTQVVNQDWEKSQGYERNFTYDLTLIPVDPLMFNLSYSVDLLKASTPSAQSSTLYIPPFTGNVYSWAFTTSYAPKDNLSIFNTLDYSRAKNANNNYAPTTGAFLYGVDDEWYDAVIGIKWSPKKNLSIEPHYGYYGFRSYQSVETGNYTAHVIMVDVKITW